MTAIATIDVTVTVAHEVAQALCDNAEILIHDGQIPGVPNGVYFDTANGRWTWSLEEAVRWAIVALAER